ncbi:hypothetical protein [Asticcacaulis sp. EMRT-3]|uniref:hypothetical protein n=1 Tax=Asticcacaulis sp. EMRT-3 TaxID=3040349 RepID=UPI0024AEB8A5|nr:hypothetical protein [Asticcacaulis sp. EMRT-3]MDI7775437.1 hypothetical protein [Asticcacaulis sp. EMRT-3]
MFGIKSGLSLATVVCMAAQLTGCHAAPKGSPATTFRIDLAIPQADRKAIRDAGEKVTVDVYYFGTPTAQHQGEADQAGRIRLGDDLFDVGPDAPGLTVSGAGIDHKLLGHVIDEMPHVMINAYSTDKAGSETHRIDCHYYFGTIAEAKAHPAEVSCETGTP